MAEAVRPQKRKKAKRKKEDAKHEDSRSTWFVQEDTVETRGTTPEEPKTETNDTERQDTVNTADSENQKEITIAAEDNIIKNDGEIESEGEQLRDAGQAIEDDPGACKSTEGINEQSDVGISNEDPKPLEDPGGQESGGQESVTEIERTKSQLESAECSTNSPIQQHEADNEGIKSTDENLTEIATDLFDEQLQNNPEVEGSSLESSLFNEEFDQILHKNISTTQESSVISQPETVEYMMFENPVLPSSAVQIEPANAIPALPVFQMLDASLAPFTEEQLKMFYYNPELEQVTVFIDQFLKNTVKENHEFYELVNNYQKCRTGLVQVINNIETTNQEIKSCQEEIWTTKKCQFKAEGLCKDKVKVQKTINYEQMEYDENQATLLSRKLNEVRGFVHEDYQLKCYNSQLAKIRIEFYIHEMLSASRLLKMIKSEDAVTAVLPRDISSDDVRSLGSLQDCISVLFSFKRLHDLEEGFKQDLETWLETLVSILQRAGALPDHFFLLNHLVRCPPSTIAPMAHFVQFPKFEMLNSNENWNSPLVHHFVVMLATLALPVKERTKFLSKYKQTMKPSINRAISWTLVDEDREEDENPEDSWCLMLEVDLVAVFEQFPFESLLKFLLRMDTQEASYSPMNSTSNDVIRLLAFASCLAKLLGQMFETYNLLRYRQFVKRISRTIRWLVQVLADHWCAYRSWRIEICGDSDKDIPKFMTVLNQYSLERLQLEFDQFFSKATEQILQSHSVGALQFLASMPYEAISTNAAWSLLNRLANARNDKQHQESGIASVIPSVNAPGEAVFLLTSLGNMATSRTEDDREFIEIATKNILEISYVNKSTREICSRNGRDLLATVSSKHPFVMSYLLSSIAGLTETIAEDCVYILKALPFHLWFPMARDLEMLRSWLLEHQLNSLQHKMARAVLSQMNFDVDQETGKLFLAQNIHFAIAVMLVEVYGSCIPDGPGGLKNLEYDDGGFISQVGKFAVQSINKIINAQIQDEFIKWCWDILLSLKLHKSDAPSKEVDPQNDNTLLTLEESNSEADGSWFEKTLSVFQKLDTKNLEMEHCPEMLNVQRAVSTRGCLACYVALAMTKLGHSPDLFVSRGESLLLMLLDAGWIDSVLRIVSNVVPLFVKCSHLLGPKNQFLTVIDSLVHMDANKAGYTEKIWQYPEPGLYSQRLASVITNHIVVTSKQSEEHGNEIIAVWFMMLSNLSNWYRDLSVQYLFDHICKVTYFFQRKMDVMANLLSEQFQNLVELQAPRGIISSVMAWVSSSAPISLLEIKKIPDYSYYGYAVLQMEMLLVEKTGLWNEIISELMTNPKITAESAFKKASSCVKAAYLPPFESLSIFRFADQGMSTNADHPILPLIWQQFFKLFLQKQKQDAGMPNRTGVGYRFFETVARTALAKKIRSHLYSIASYHQEKSTPKGDEEPSLSAKSQIHDQSMHATLASLYQAMALWMEEPRLHDPNLFLDALPEIYYPALLAKIFQGDETPWFQFLDMNCVANEVESIESLWTMSVNKTTRTRRITRLNAIDDLMIKPTAVQQVVKRLTRENQPKEPPSVSETQNPIPEVSLQLLLTRPRLIQDLNHDLERVVLFAKKSCIKWDENVALDEEYLELLADLYEHILRHFMMWTPCDGKSAKNRFCTGPANLVIRYEERSTRERNERCIRDNRTVWQANLSNETQQLSYDLCVGAFYVESVISTLMKSLQYASAEQKASLESAGVELFYLLAELINNDVKRCYPAIQFFSSCTEILGKEFIANNDTEQLRLLKTILSEEASVSFLAPHFNPSIHSRGFLQLYAFIADSNAETKLTTLFVLLSKFDVRGWLVTQPALSERVFLVRAVMTSLQNFGLEPSQEVEIVFGQYRSHMVFLLSHKFPDLYRETLELIAVASRERVLAPICWGDFLLCIGCDVDGHVIASYVEYNPLQLATVSETINWLAAFFADVSKRLFYSTSELYTTWRPYIRYVTKLWSYLFSRLTEPYLTQGFSSDPTKERFISNAWSMIFAAYRPWIVPRKADKSWPSQHVEDAICLVQSFTESARVMAECAMVENTFSFGMNMIWTFYCAEVAAGIKEETSLEIYHGLLATLSWRVYCPSVQDLERMLELHIDNPAAFYFLGTIMCGLNWPMIIQRYQARDDRTLANALHICILRIFVMLSVNRLFIGKTGSQFQEFTNVAMECNWNDLDSQDVGNICGWFSENCDPVTILEEEIYEATVLRLLKTVCWLLPIVNPPADFSEKRKIYVKMIVKLVTRAASKKSAHQRFNKVIPTLLRDIERTFEARTVSRNELTSLLNVVLTLLNCISEGPVLDGIENQIHVYVCETNCETLLLCTLSAACRALASLDQLVRLCEKVIESFLAKQSDSDFKNAWSKVLEVLVVPDLNQDDFIRKALTKQCLVTLYAFNLHRLSLCSGAAEELKILIEIFRWCLDTQPSPASSEKTLLLWWQVVSGMKRQIDMDKDQRYLGAFVKYISLLSHYCQQISEDKSYSGLLGAIGLGKKSILPAQFRFTARCLHVFLTAQLPGNGSYIRCFPDAPGSITGSTSKDKTMSPTNEAKMALQNLTNLQKNKSYASMKDEVRWITQLISDPKTCLIDGPLLLSYICKQLYYKTNFIIATVSVDD